MVRYGATKAIDLDCRFLHGGLPQRRLVAAPSARKASGGIAAVPEPAPATRGQSKGKIRSPSSAKPRAKLFLAVLAHPAVASKEATVRLYDHEVQGATVLRPYDGLCSDGPQDAAVLKPPRD